MIYLIIIIIIWNIVITYYICKMIQKLRYYMCIPYYKIDKSGIWRTNGCVSERKLRWPWYWDKY